MGRDRRVVVDLNLVTHRVRVGSREERHSVDPTIEANTRRLPLLPTNLVRVLEDLPERRTGAWRAGNLRRPLILNCSDNARRSRPCRRTQSTHPKPEPVQEQPEADCC